MPLCEEGHWLGNLTGVFQPLETLSHSLTGVNFERVVLKLHVNFLIDICLLFWASLASEIVSFLLITLFFAWPLFFSTETSALSLEIVRKILVFDILVRRDTSIAFVITHWYKVLIFYGAFVQSFRSNFDRNSNKIWITSMENNLIQHKTYCNK